MLKVFEALWWVVLLPFRLVGWLVAMVGRTIGVVLGFALMVAGVALSAGSLFPFGIPLFILGLLLMLKGVS